MSTQASISVESSLSNGIKTSQSKGEVAPISVDHDSAGVLPSTVNTVRTVATHNMRNLGDQSTVEASLMGIEDTVLDSEPTVDAPSPIAAVILPPTSSSADDTQPTSALQTAEVEEPKQQQGLTGNVEQANGTQTGGSVPPTTSSSSGLATDREGEMSQGGEENQVAPASANDSSVDVIDMKEHTDASPAPEGVTVITSTKLPHHPPIPVPEGSVPELPVAPAPSPSPSRATSSAPNPTATMDDQEMPDVPPPGPAKVARARDEDDDDGPATKRSKMDENGPAAPEFKVPVLPEILTNIADAPTATSSEQTQSITKAQQKFLLRVVQNIKRLNDAAPFTKPVDVVALNIPSYPTIVTKPMDLRTVEEKVKEDRYRAVEEYLGDFNQIIENAILFNGLDHVVTKNAQNIKASFDKQMTNLPGSDVAEPAPADKKKKGSTASTTKVPASRRESRSSLPGPARSPVTAASPTTTFALGPQGVPLIRRDSNVGDGRPKREIHPPAPRDLPYASQKPKKKKYQLELKFCQHVVNELQKPKHAGYGFAFQTPVDPVALNIPHYHKIIKQPMDLSTVASKLNHGQYENAKEFEADIRLMFQNCYKFNPVTDPVYDMGKTYEGVFNTKWAEKSRWIETNTPTSGRQSPGSSPEPEEDEEDEEEEEEEEEQIQLGKLQQQIAAMSRQVELITQKKKTPPVPPKKGKGGKAAKEKTKKGTSATPAKAEKKASKPAKKEKTPYVTYEQKQDISNRINSLSETRMATALKIIRDNMPSLQVLPSTADDPLYLCIVGNKSMHFSPEY